ASALRAAAASRAALTLDESASFRMGVVNRLKAERDASFLARVRGMFEDMHFVYAGFGAAAAALVCAVIMVAMMRFPTTERPDSLAAIVAFLATPGSSANGTAVDAASHARWTARFQAATESAEQEAVFQIAAIVTREGRVADLERLHARGHSSAAEQAKLIERWMDVVSRARLEPGQAEGAAANGNMVWLITRTTVRPTDAVRDLVVPAGGKKRVAAFGSAPSRTACA